MTYYFQYEVADFSHMSQKENSTRLKFWNWLDLAKVSYSSVSLVGSPDPKRPHYLKFSPSFFHSKTAETHRSICDRIMKMTQKQILAGIIKILLRWNFDSARWSKRDRELERPLIESLWRSFFQCCPLPPSPPTLRKKGCRVWPPLVLDDSKRLPLLNPAPLVIGLKVSYIEFDFGVKFSTLMYL